jgi:hypothetical protein
MRTTNESGTEHITVDAGKDEKLVLTNLRCQASTSHLETVSNGATSNVKCIQRRVIITPGGSVASLEN